MSPFKRGDPSPNSNRVPAQDAITFPTAATLPSQPLPVISGVCKSVITVFSVSTTLRSQGYLAGQEIPSITLQEEHAPSMFESLLASFLAQSHGPGLLPPYQIPPLLGDGSTVGLLSLYLAVQEHGGFDAVMSWADIAEAVGLNPTMDVPIKLVYCKYLCPLEQSFRRGRMQGEVAGCSGGVRKLCHKEDKFLSLPGYPCSSDLLPVNHKREELMGMLNWVHHVARGLDQRHSVKKIPRNHLSMVLMFRRHMFEDYGFSTNPHGSASPHSGLATEDGEYNRWDDQLSAGGSWNRNSSANVCSFGRAEIPEWRGNPSSTYDDPDMLRFLGEPFLIPEKIEALDAPAVGKGRLDNCSCLSPGSIVCIRFHVTESKIELKHKLGLSYHAMGFDQTGEDVALTWTEDEERKFETIILKNLPSAKSKFWDEIIAAFPAKSRQDLVSYYYNVFLLRRRAFQNRVAGQLRGADSDDESIEPAFLHLRLGTGQSRFKSAASSKKRKDS